MLKGGRLNALMRPIGRALLGFVAAAMLAGGLLVVSQAPASAAPGCYGAGCAGWNPAQNGCDADAVTVRTRDVPGGTIQLRYSHACRANWARATFGGWSYVEPYVWNPNGQSYGWVQYNYSWRWTRMVNGLITACAGAHVWDAWGNYKGWYFAGCA